MKDISLKDLIYEAIKSLVPDKAVSITDVLERKILENFILMSKRDIPKGQYGK